MATLALQLQRTVGNRATARLLAGHGASPPHAARQVLQRDPLDETGPPLPAAGAAGGCGLCYADVYKGAIGPRDAGTKAHDVIQQAMWKKHSDLLPYELFIRGRRETGEIDLAREVPPNTLEIGEIKPQDSIEPAIKDIDWYIGLVKQDPRYKKYNVRPLELKCPQPLDFPTLSADCPTQNLYVANTKGLYLYFCTPSFKELKAKGCKCKKRRRDDEDERPPMIGDGVDTGKHDEKGKTDTDKKGGDDEFKRPPPHLIDLGEWGKVVTAAAAAILALAIIIGSVPSPLTVLEAIAAAIGWALARLLIALGFGIAGTALASAATGGEGEAGSWCGTRSGGRTRACGGCA